MRRRIITIGMAVFAALAVVLVGIQLTGTGASPAQAAAGTSGYYGWYIDSTGASHYLPWRGERVGGASTYTWGTGTKKITSWYARVLPEGRDADTPATPTPTPTPTPPPSPSPGVAGEEAPILSTVGGSASGSILLTWIKGVPPADGTIAAYVIEVRPSTTPTWTGALTTTTDDTITSFRVTGLEPATLYYVRVRAKYGSGQLGIYSNILSGKTPTS